MYVVFLSYYKHGEVDMQLIGPDAIRTFCLQELEDYQVEEDFRDLPLDELIALTVKEGNSNVEAQGGWGVRYIIKGDNLVNF